MPLFLPPVEQRFRFGVLLTPTPNGANRTFSTGEEFLPDVVELYHNGRRLQQAVEFGNANDGDFYVTESGGIGTGYDTVIFVSFSPVSRSILRANYLLP